MVSKKQKTGSEADVKNVSPRGSSDDVWKIIAIGSVLLFAAVLVSGFFRIGFREPEPRGRTIVFSDDIVPEEQFDQVTDIIEQDLLSRGEQLSDYIVQQMGPVMSWGGSEDTKRMVSVSLQDQNKTLMYLVDLDSGTIVMFSSTEFYDWMNTSQMGRPGFIMPREKHFVQTGFFPPSAFILHPFSLLALLLALAAIIYVVIKVRK